MRTSGGWLATSPRDVLREQVADQVGILSDIAEAEGTSVRYLKPHGALYHRVIDDEPQARAVLAGSGSLPVLGMPGGLLLELARDAGRVVFREGFPDRAYARRRAGCCPATSPGRSSPTPTRSPPRRWSSRPPSTLSACTATAPER